MASLPLTALRPLAFPSHTWAALVCLRTGRVLTLLPSATADVAVCDQALSMQALVERGDCLGNLGRTRQHQSASLTKSVATT